MNTDVRHPAPTSGTFGGVLGLVEIFMIWMQNGRHSCGMAIADSVPKQYGRLFWRCGGQKPWFTQHKWQLCDYMFRFRGFLDQMECLQLMENPIYKWFLLDDLGVPPWLRKPPFGEFGISLGHNRNRGTGSTSMVALGPEILLRIRDLKRSAWPWRLVITDYFNEIIHSIHGVT